MHINIGLCIYSVLKQERMRIKYSFFKYFFRESARDKNIVKWNCQEKKKLCMDSSIPVVWGKKEEKDQQKAEKHKLNEGGKAALKDVSASVSVYADHKRKASKS